MPKKTAFIALVVEPEIKELIKRVSTKQGIQISDFVRICIMERLTSMGYDIKTDP